MSRLLFVLLIFSNCVFAKEKICLNMIVKNESQVIERCLASVKPLIDYWVIVDTGSIDGTQKIIKKYLKDVPGKLYERPWKNFGENRTEALQLAKRTCDYILFMDADDTLEFDEGFQLKELKADLYNMWRGTSDCTYIKPQLVRANLPWKWVGATHEYLDCDQNYTSDTLEKVRYVSGVGGHRSSSPKKFQENVVLLTESLKKNPNNCRDVFYLAESYRDAGEKGKALEYFQKRITMGGWQEEVFWSYLQIGEMLRSIGVSKTVVIESLKQAHQYRPHRIEPIYYLAELFNEQGNYSEAYKCIKSWEHIPQPAYKDWLFNMDWMRDYGLLLQLSVCTYYLGKYQESLDACDKLLKVKDLPENWRKTAERNRLFALSKVTTPTDK